MLMTRYTQLLCAALTLSSLLGCQADTPNSSNDASKAAPAAVTARTLRMPETAFEGTREIIERMLIVDDYGSDAADVPGMIKTLRSLKVRSTAYYRYLIQRGDETRVVKVKIIVFTDAEAAAKDWQVRNHPSVVPGTTPLALGDEALQIKDQKHLIRLGHVQLEIGRKDEPELLEAFSSAYVGFVAGQLGRARTG